MTVTADGLPPGIATRLRIPVIAAPMSKVSGVRFSSAIIRRPAPQEATHWENTAEARSVVVASTMALVLRVGDTFTFGGTGELRSCTWPMRWNYAQVIVAGWIH
jgi:hypothetical protein